MGCYNNPCSYCGGKGCGKCCPTVDDCDCDLTLAYVPHTKCTISITHNGCSDTLDLCPAIKNCETTTHLDFNNQTGCIEYANEKWLSTDGAEGELETVCVSEFYPFIRIPDLADVEFDDELKGNCYELIYHKDMDCGEGCRSKHDHWVNWNHNYPGALVDSMDYIRGEGADGCPVLLDKPDNCSFLVFSPSCDRPTGEWQAWKIPTVEETGCEMTPDDQGYYHVVTLDDCGCPKECKMPVLPAGMTALSYLRDSVPDDPDFPWYYGSYNDKINLHLKENAPNFFGKYDLKVTVNYGVQAIKSDLMPNNYHWTSIVVPVVEGTDINTTQTASILKNWAMAAANPQIPWGTSGLRSSFTFIVPKGKEAYLHHEYRVKTIKSFPNYDNASAAYNGQKVPDAEATLNKAKYPASRLHALQVIVEPTQGATNYHPTTDPDRDKLDPIEDSYNQAYN